MPKVMVKNAYKMMTAARVTKDQKYIEVTFADEICGKVPVDKIKEHKRLDLGRVELPSPYYLLIQVKGESEPAGLPWDFARRFCDPDFDQKQQRWGQESRQRIGDRITQSRNLYPSGPMSQSALANMAGISRGALINIENGETSVKVETLQKIADALGVEMIDLLTDNTFKNQNENPM